MVDRTAPKPLYRAHPDTDRFVQEYLVDLCGSARPSCRIRKRRGNRASILLPNCREDGVRRPGTRAKAWGYGERVLSEIVRWLSPMCRITLTLTTDGQDEVFDEMPEVRAG